jgi:hypothetical protein
MKAPIRRWVADGFESILLRRVIGEKNRSPNRRILVI